MPKKLELEARETSGNDKNAKTKAVFFDAGLLHTNRPNAIPAVQPTASKH